MLTDALWRLLFCTAIAVLMLGILLLRSEPSPLWVLISYPTVGAALAMIASRTSPSPDDIARVETSVIAAAAIFVLACLVNLLLIDHMAGQIREGRSYPEPFVKRWSIVLLPLVSVLLWWALERRLTRFRKLQAELAAKRKGPRAAADQKLTPPRFSATGDRLPEHPRTGEPLRRHSR